jgi:hypothetical protein
VGGVPMDELLALLRRTADFLVVIRSAAVV